MTNIYATIQKNASVAPLMAGLRSGGNSREFIKLVGNAPDDVITSGSARARSQSSSTG